MKNQGTPNEVVISMKRHTIAVIAILLLIAGSSPPRGEASAQIPQAPQRILSLAPAATEILFYLGLGDRVIGVTEYCTWPPEAREKMNIGDMMHVNLELVLAPRPDLVVLSNMNGHIGKQMEELDIPVGIVYQDDFAQICESMLRVGAACGIAEEAERRVDSLKIAAMAAASKGRRSEGPPKRVLVVVARDEGDTEMRKLYVAGPASFYEDLLRDSGAANAFTNDAPYASISREGLIRLDPDLIIELFGAHGMKNVSNGEILAQWGGLADVRAAKAGDVAVIRGDFTLRAGPRYPEILEAFNKVINGGAREITGD
jgi:iron complex transport system substrate-binding protein